MWWLAILWYPSDIHIYTLDAKIIIVHISALLFTKIGRIWWTIVDIARSVFDSSSNTIFATICWRWGVALSCWWLNTTTTMSAALIKTETKKMFRTDVNVKRMNVLLTLPMVPIHRRLWSMHSCYEVHIFHVDTKVHSHIRFRLPKACAVFCNQPLHFRTINERMEAAIKYKHFSPT